MKLLYFVAMVVYIQSLTGVQIEMSVKENSKIGTLVGNVFYLLPPHQNNSKLEFIKNDYGVDSYFSLLKDTGDLLVRSVIDRETICEEKKDDNCFVSLLADRDTDVLQIRVKIEDVNDNSPMFLSAQKTIYVQENIPNGTTYFLPVAQDRDTSKFGISNYSMSGFRAIDSRNRDKYASQDRFFQIEGSLSPQVLVVGTIDREEISSFVFLLVASDVDDRRGTCTITVIVTDVNDNSPEWTKDNYKVNIKECQSHGEILDFDATDKDDPNTSNGRITYRLSDRTKNREKMSQIFYINVNKLYLSNNRPSDLSNFGILILIIVAVDGNGRMKETSVEVTVEDCNDQPPIITITKRYGDVLENVKEKISLSTVNVKDSDRGKNGLFECSLNDTTVLSLVNKHSDLSENNIVYKIETNGDHSFDRESGATYSVEIKCSDQGDPPMSSTQRFTINILDVNDNAPSFEDKTQVFYVPENNVIGGVVGQVKAVDLDSGVNGIVKYTILGDNDDFTIGMYGEILTKVSFDREKQSKYEFVLVATDTGSPTLNDSMTVKVIVDDVNDCRPIFVDEYFFKVTESFGEMVKSEKIGEVKATDQDKGVNGTVNYRMLSMKALTLTGLLSVTPQLERLIRVGFDGGISLYGTLDREVMSAIHVTIEAFDHGSPKMSTQTTVVIEILDINDNAPTFLFPTKLSRSINISLDSDIGVHVATVTASDPDQGLNGTVQFSFEGSGVLYQDSPLKMESDGKIIIASELNKYSKSRRLPALFSVRASDGGTPPKSTTGTLFVYYIDSSQVPFHQVSARKSTEYPRNSHNIYNNNNNGSSSSRGNSLWPLSKGNKHNNNNYISNATISDSMMLLYCLAAILFFVFIIVFSVLLYIYCSRVYVNSEGYSKKRYQSSNSTIIPKHNTKELHPMTRSREEFRGFQPGSNEDGATVCFVNDDGSSYTHLMMVGNNKYTPMIHQSTSRPPYSHQGDANQSDVISVSQNVLDSIIGNSQFSPASPNMHQSPIKYPQPNVNSSPLVNCPENYSTLQDKVSFDSLTRKQSVRTLSSTNKSYGAENVDLYLQQQRNFNSPYVTSSFV